MSRLITGLVLVFLLASPSFGAAKEKPFTGRVIKDVVYVERGRKELKLDVFVPAGEPKKAPMVLVIHGGGFIGGVRLMMAPLCKVLAENGMVAFSLQYRLAPRYRFPAPTEDTRCALRWLARHGPEYGGDPARIGVTGESAGGYLSAMSIFPAADRFSEEPCPEGVEQVPAIRAAVLYYGPYDLVKSYDYDYWGIRPLYYFALGATLKQAPERYREQSPITYLHPGLPAILLQSGTYDYFLPEAKDLYQRLKEMGEPVELIVWEKAKHGFAVIPGSVPGPVNFDKTAEFFLEHLAAD